MYCYSKSTLSCSAEASFGIYSTVLGCLRIQIYLFYATAAIKIMVEPITLSTYYSRIRFEAKMVYSPCAVTCLADFKSYSPPESGFRAGLRSKNFEHILLASVDDAVWITKEIYKEIDNGLISASLYIEKSEKSVQIGGSLVRRSKSKAAESSREYTRRWRPCTRRRPIR
jgi:hypothetical protein